MALSDNRHQELILSIRDISKGFPGVQALHNVSFDVFSGEVHGLVGANGAGKSTLNKIIGGVIDPDAGEILLNGVQVLPLNPKKSQEMGVQVIHQDLNLVPGLPVYDNIFLGHEYRKSGVFVDTERMRRESRQILDDLGVNINPDELVQNLSVSLKQMVAVAAALQRKASLLIFDETTAAITQEETEHLFARIRKLKANGLGIIYVTHHLNEIFEICDRVTILRDGKFNGTLTINDTNMDEVISLMVGVKLTEQYPAREVKTGKEMLAVEELSDGSHFHDISFNVLAGEVLGFFGLIGAGRTEVFKSIFGANPYKSGKIFLNQTEVLIKKPAQAVGQGIGFLPEDRKQEGLLLMMSVLTNTTLPSIRSISNGFFIPRKMERQIVNRQVEGMRIATPNVEREVCYLSGGNQQKVVLSKWLVTESSILILDQPTRGIDVRAKFEIYRLINQLAEAGHAIILISDELEEIIGMCDRIIVMHEGKISGRLAKKEATQNLLLKMANA